MLPELLSTESNRIHPGTRYPEHPSLMKFNRVKVLDEPELESSVTLTET